MLRTRVRAGTVASLVLSLVFAVIFTAISSFDLFVDRWTPQIGSPTRIALRVPFGSRIVAPSDGSSYLAYEYRRITIPPFTVLDESKDEHREAFAYESLRRPPSALRLGALVFLYATLSLMLTAYMQRLGQSRVRLLRTQIGIFSIILLIMVIAKGILLFTGLPEYWVPASAAALWIALAFDRRTAILANLMVAFIVASLLRFDLFLLIVLLVRGMSVTLFLLNRKRPRFLALNGALAGLATALAYLAIDIILVGNAHPIADISRLFDSPLLACVGGGALGGFMAWALRDPAERMLGQVTRERLLDLTDIEHPVLQKIAREAPGTWEHSRAMANLAEGAAAAIGADSLLTRVGAYYHDAGKTIQSKYFVENLHPGEESPHADLPPEVSADAIMAHVVLGAKMLREAGVPEPVVEFAYTHHGTQLVEFFWHKYKEKQTEPNLPEDHFRYPGMKPQTKETAILMLVDSIEAASRTISPPSFENFEEMIRRVVYTKLGSGQLDECGLTLEDLRIITARVADALVAVYHGRIKYPWQRQNEHPPAHSFATPPPNPVKPLPVPLPEPPEALTPSLSPKVSTSS